MATQTAIEVEGLSQALPARAEPRRVHDAARDARRRRRRATRRTTRDLWALRDVSFSVPKDEALGLIGPQRRRQDDAAEGARPDHAADVRRLAHARARRGAARRRHRLPPRADRPREHLPERRDPRHVAARRRPPLRRDRRLRGSRALPRHAAQALLVGDVPAPRVRGRGARRAGHRDRRRGARDRRRAVPREVPREDVRVRAEGRTVVFVSHDLGSITQLCRRAIWLDHGRIQADGPSEEVVQRYVRGSVGDVPRADFTPDPTQRVQVLAAEVAGRARPSARPPGARPAADAACPLRRARAAPGRRRRALRPGPARDPRARRGVG